MLITSLLSCVILQFPILRVSLTSSSYETSSTLILRMRQFPEQISMTRIMVNLGLLTGVLKPLLLSIDYYKQTFLPFFFFAWGTELHVKKGKNSD